MIGLVLRSFLPTYKLIYFSGPAPSWLLTNDGSVARAPIPCAAAVRTAGGCPPAAAPDAASHSCS